METGAVSGPRILVVGNAVLDILLSVERTPREDEEMRARERRVDLGGNGANTARVLAGLGRSVFLLATLAPDDAAETLRRLLGEAGVGTQRLVTATAGSTPVSYILLDATSGARTIIHHRELAELGFDDFAACSSELCGWVHFEGRNIPAVARMIEALRANGYDGRVSIEVEKPRAGIEALLPFVDLALFSRPYAEAKGYASAPELLHAVVALAPAARMTCTWGADGAWLIEPDRPIVHSSANAPERVVETVGAGDVFNAGLIDGLLGGLSAEDSLRRATTLAGKKVGQLGFAGL